nr:PREDICTED: alpha-tocopherol transfer protein-like [Bemisia tabaci]XP_018909419.1 PREDICTED: alpha-tocopherol transfer protein-like [Bemisia tabaci]
MGVDVPIPSNERLQEDLQNLKEWMSKEPHLPKIDDDAWLMTFLYNNKFSLEKTKFKLERYYTFRTKFPEILKNRDPDAPEILSSCENDPMALSSEKTEDNSRILYIRYGADASKLDATQYAKRIFMLLDSMLLNEEDRLASLISITDFRQFGLSHILKVTMVLGKIAEVFTDAYSERLRAVHLLNVPSLAEKFIETIKTFFPKKISDRFYVHSCPEKTLLAMVDKSVVSRDFGGDGPSLTDLQDSSMKEIRKQKKWFELQDEVCTNEALRRMDDKKLEEMKGSFRKLEVD